MSDVTLENGHGEKRRILACLAAACVVHAAILIALALGIGVGSGPIATPLVTIDLAYSPEPGMDAPGGPAGAAGGSPGAGPEASAPASAPVASTVVASPAAGGQGSGSSDFIIPTPRAQAADPSAAPGGPAFREAGGKTGVVQRIPSVPSTVPAPAVPPVQQGKGAGAAASSGAGASSVQRSGTGVLVPGSAGSSSGGKLDLSQLDKSLAPGAGGSGGTRGTGGGSGGTGGSGGGGGSGGSGGSGAGTGGGSGGSGSGGGGGQSYSVVWGAADAGKGRTPVSTPSPKVPAWVSAQGLTLSVTVSFTLLADGLIGGAMVQKSSGYADVDSAVLNAILRWTFTPAKGAAPAKGIIPYEIRTH